MPKAAPSNPASTEPVVDVLGPLPEIPDNAAEVWIYNGHPRQNGKRCGMFSPIPLDIERAVGEQWGGGKYWVVPVDERRQALGGFFIAIDQSVRPIRPAANRSAEYAAPMNGFDPFMLPPAAPVDPVAMLVRELADMRRELAEIKAKPAQPIEDRITTKDLLTIMQAQPKPESSLREIMQVLPLFMDMAGKRTPMAELGEMLKLTRTLHRAAPADDDDAGAGFNIKDLVQLLPGLLATPPAQVAPPPPRARQLPPPAQPRPALVQQSQPPTPPPPAQSAPPPAAAHAEPAPAWLAMLAPHLAERFAKGETASDCVDQLFDQFPADQVAPLVNDRPEGSLAVAMLQTHPSLNQYVARVFAFEALVREELAESENDDYDGEDDDEPSADDIDDAALRHPRPEPEAQGDPATPSPTATPTPSTPGTEPPSSKGTDGRKPNRSGRTPTTRAHSNP